MPPTQLYKLNSYQPTSHQHSLLELRSTLPTSQPTPTTSSTPHHHRNHLPHTQTQYPRNTAICQHNLRSYIIDHTHYPHYHTPPPRLTSHDTREYYSHNPHNPTPTPRNSCMHSTGHSIHYANELIYLRSKLNPLTYKPTKLHSMLPKHTTLPTHINPVFQGAI